jgi:serine protease Do
MKIDAAELRRVPTAHRMLALACAIGLAVAGGALLGRAVTSHAFVTHEQQNSSQSSANLGARRSPAVNGFAEIVEAVKPAVFGVLSKRAENSRDAGALRSPTDQFRAPPGVPAIPARPRPGRSVTSQGSGFFISADGYAVTNNRVVEGSAIVQIQTDDQKTYAAKVVGTDPASDLALLKVDGRDDFPFVQLAAQTPRIGDWVLAIGNPFGLGGTVTAGIVSARERHIGVLSYDSLIQIDAPINKGDSGGPTFDLNGRVIGVNTMIFSPSGGSIGIAFAVPADTVKSVIPQLKDKGAVTRGRLGVQIQPVTAEIAGALGLERAEGVLVAEAQADGPAAKAGIAAGDIIASLNGAPVKDARELTKTIAGTAPGTAVELGVLRQSSKRTVKVTLDQLPVQAPAPGTAPETTGRGGSAASAPSEDLGLRLAPASRVPGAGEHGVVVTGVDPTGLGADQGFGLGDVILEVSGKAVTTPSEIQSALGNARREGKENVLIWLRSGATMRFITVPTG